MLQEQKVAITIGEKDVTDQNDKFSNLKFETQRPHSFCKQVYLTIGMKTNYFSLLSFRPQSFPPTHWPDIVAVGFRPCLRGLRQAVSGVVTREKENKKQLLRMCCCESLT